jgi:hypothetical protein
VRLLVAQGRRVEESEREREKELEGRRGGREKAERRIMVPEGSEHSLRPQAGGPKLKLNVLA